MNPAAHYVLLFLAAWFVNPNGWSCLQGPAPVLPADGPCCYSIDYDRNGYVDLRDWAAFSNDAPAFEQFAKQVRLPDCTADGIQCRAGTAFVCDWGKAPSNVSREFGVCPMPSGKDR